jgi:hypothetical protein
MSIKDKIDEVFSDLPELLETGTTSSPAPATGKGGDGADGGIARNKEVLGTDEDEEKEETDE